MTSNFDLNDFKVNKLKWSKKLYIKTGYPDNYVDESFLDLKRTNGLLKRRFNIFQFI